MFLFGPDQTNQVNRITSVNPLKVTNKFGPNQTQEWTLRFLSQPLVH